MYVIEEGHEGTINQKHQNKTHCRSKTKLAIREKLIIFMMLDRVAMVRVYSNKTATEEINK